MDDAKRFAILCDILRASHFEWRRAALALCPELDPAELVKRYWEESAKDAARYYLKKIDPSKNLPDQVAALFVSSSLVMGEVAELAPRSPDGQVQVRHRSCPWFEWSRRQDLLGEDQLGCDHFIQSLLDEINAALGRSLRFETISSLPNGDDCCLRRFWEEAKP